MYVIRDGPVHQHAQTVRRGSMPRYVYVGCGSVGIILAILGGVLLGLGQRAYKQRLIDGDEQRTDPGKKETPTFVLVGSVILGLGFIMTVLSVLLSISWSSQSSTGMQAAAYRRASRLSSQATREVTEDADDVELNGYRDTIRV